jgi:DNA replication protein DnaC
MQSMAVEFQRLRSAAEALPDDGACPKCGYFDVQHPDVRRILTDRDPTKRLLYQAQCKCRGRDEIEQRDRELRYAQSGLPTDHQRTVESFIVRPGTEPMIEATKRFIGRQGPRILVLVGRTGTGKSHLLEAIGRHALEADRTVRYDLASTFLNRLRHTYDSDAGEDVHDLLAWYQRRDTLLIDDIGVESSTAWVREQLTTVVEERLHSGGWMAVGTNLTKDALAERMGDRLASRLYAVNPALDNVAVVVNTAQDYRA